MKLKKEIRKQKVAKPHPGIPSQKGNPNNWYFYAALGGIILVSFLVYLPVLHNEFVWDDDYYIKNNPLIYALNLKEIFSQNLMGNYHPLTVLTLALEYQLFGLNETGYHLVNIFLHLLNVILVFYVLFRVSDNVHVALIASLLWGIHPMHVESVAWAAALKDLLYTFFFLSSYIFYLKYLKNRQTKFYIIALLLFLFSLLSKAMAASLPLVLLITDYLKGRKLDYKLLIEKIPFFLLAITFGVIAVLAQKSFEAIPDTPIYSITQRLIFASFGFITYLLKFIFPLNLSAVYPYPVNSGTEIPYQYYTYLLGVIGVIGYTIYSVRFTKKIMYGIGFFIATILLVLQLLPVGYAVMADRYSYIPSIGIFYLAGEGLILSLNSKFKRPAVILIIAFTVFFSFVTYNRCGIWKNNMTLWNDVISQYQTVDKAYNNRGVAFMNEKRDDEALNDFNKAIELKPYYAEAHFNRGNVYMNAKENDLALNDFNKAIELKPNYAKAFHNRGSLFMYQNKNEEALSDFNKAIELQPDYPIAYFNRGTVFFNEKRYKEAIINYSKAIELKADYAEAYYNKGASEFYLGDKNSACMDIKQAASLGYQPAADTYLQICK